MTWTKASLALSLALVPGVVMAQSGGNAAPKSGDMAVSASLGFARAFDSDFDGIEAVFDGSFEYHTSDRISWRGMLGTTSFDADGFPGEVDVNFFNANFIWSWHSENLRPYVTGGIGLYDVDLDVPGFNGNGDVEIGLNGGGGVDIYFNPHWAIEIEGLFHGFSGDGPDTFFAATAGAKFKF